MNLIAKILAGLGTRTLFYFNLNAILVLTKNSAQFIFVYLPKLMTACYQNILTLYHSFRIMFVNVNIFLFTVTRRRTGAAEMGREGVPKIRTFCTLENICNVVSDR